MPPATSFPAPMSRIPIRILRGGKTGLLPMTDKRSFTMQSAIRSSTKATFLHGRRLSSYCVNQFKYGADGIRIKKNSTSYTLDGSKILKETTGSTTITYYYGVNGVIGFRYNGTDYYYRKNLQGDVIAIYNTNGTCVVTYAYDAWGKVLSVGGSFASTVGAVNPFRYRGYYYDTETGLYYLQTRYYDPETGRFLNSDALEYLGQGAELRNYNLFAYCGNNPVMGYDPSGCFVISALVILTLGGLAVGFGATAYADYRDDGEMFNGSVQVEDYIVNTMVVGTIGFAVGTVAPAAGSFLTSSFTLTLPSVLGSASAGGATAIATISVTSAEVIGIGALGVAIALAQWEPGSWPGDDPTQSPGDGFGWRGPGEVGTNLGEWYNPTTGDQLHPDLNHPLPKGPHWGWRNKIKRILQDIFKT